MDNKIENFYISQEETNKEILLYLRKLILSLDSENISQEWKYSAPFFCYRGRMFCYFWVDKKTFQPYIGIVEGKRIDHPILEQGNRSRMKILPIDKTKDLDIEGITEVLTTAINFYRNGIIKTKY